MNVCLGCQDITITPRVLLAEFYLYSGTNRQVLDKTCFPTVHYKYILILMFQAFIYLVRLKLQDAGKKKIVLVVTSALKVHLSEDLHP